MADPKGVLVVPVGFRSDGSIHALELDNSDRLKVLVDSITGTVTVVQTDPTQLAVTWGATKKGARGAGKGDLVSNTALAAGTNTLNLTSVTAAHVWVIKSITMRYSGTVAGVALRSEFVIGGTVYEFQSVQPPVAGVFYGFLCDFPLAAGDNVRMAVTGATLNDDAFLYATYEDLS